MSGPDLHRVEEVFSFAIDLVGPDRARFVESTCAGDSALADYIQRLLAAHDAAGGFLRQPTLPHVSFLAARDAVEADHAEQAIERPGACIGPYELLELIGEGGFGSVFRAEQRTPVVRSVALKIIKLGMDTRQVIARFEAERQALARMDHPNIARVLDAGVTETGRPYFVMDLVDGDPIAKYCDESKASIEERLDLFAQVCAAVQHAHQKGIIHRDIKPGNVLVTVSDGRPIPKVIDFGIAKAIASRLTENTLFTEHGQLIGTPQYMSPEQAEGSLDIDTRTDVYSLGVVLYELLTGTTPFTSQELRSVAQAEIQRILREVEPPKPSTRLSQSTETLANVAAHRHTEPGRLGDMVRGELDWIVMKALEKHRDHRYETANELALDVRRFLSGEAVVAAPPSTSYRFMKFLRRNRSTVTAGALVAASLLLGTIGFAWQARIARRERDAAELDRNRAVAAEAETRRRAGELRQVAEFQARMLSRIDATDAGAKLMEDIRDRFARAVAGTDPTLLEGEALRRAATLEGELRLVNATDTAVGMIDRTILQPAIATIESQFMEQPVVDAALRQTLAELYSTLGRYDAALPLQERALETRRRVLGEEHADTLTSIGALGSLLSSQGKYAEAEPLYREALEKCRRTLGEDHPDTLIFMNNLGTLLRTRGKYGEAETCFREALDRRRRLLGEDAPGTLASLACLGGLLQDQGKLAEAEPFLRQSLEKRRRVLGEDHRETLTSIGNLGTLLIARGQLAEAEPYLREALEKDLRVLGQEHPKTIVATSNLGSLLQARGKLSEAEPYLLDALERNRRVLGDDHPKTLASLSNVGGVLLGQGKLAEAEGYYHEAVERSRRVLGEEHPDTLTYMNNLGGVLRDEGKLEEAEPYHRDVLQKRRRILGEEHARTLTSIENLGGLLQLQGKLVEAETYLREALDKRRRVLGEEHPETLTSIENVGNILRAEGKYAEAERYGREAVEKLSRVLGEDHPDTLRAVTDLVVILQAQGRPAECEPLLRELLEKRRRMLGESHADTVGSMALLGWVLIQQNTPTKAAEAEVLLRKCLAIREKLLPANHWRVAIIRSLLGGALVVRARSLLDSDHAAAMATLDEAGPLLVDSYEFINKSPTYATFQVEALRRVVEYFEILETADPGGGHDVAAAEWRAKHDAR